MKLYNIFRDNIYSFFLPSQAYIDSVLAIYDLRANPYSFNFVEFLARAEVYRVKHSLFYIDLVFVVDRENMHRGDQSEVTASNYRNWILNLAECAESLKSISSLSIFDNKHKFMSFYRKARYTHKIFPENGSIYRPIDCYCLRDVSDYYRASGFVPKFEPSDFLLEWAETYFKEKSYPFLPIVVFIRNSKTQTERNTKLQIWFDFFRAVIAQYPVKIFIVNDFWNPVIIPEDLSSRVLVCQEATISAKYRLALMQKSCFTVSTVIGSIIHCFFIDKPYLLFGWDSKYFSFEYNKMLHGVNEDLRLPWADKYQKVFPKQESTEYIVSKFKELYNLLDQDNRLVPEYYKMKHNIGGAKLLKNE